MLAQPSQKLRVIEAPAAVPSRYVEYGEIARGSTASVRYGRWVDASGFSRAVAIKRLHPELAEQLALASSFVDQAREAMRLAHANIVQTLDVIDEPGEVGLVTEYVHGESLSALLRIARAQRKSISLPVACGLVASVLRGLHAAHETCGDGGERLALVHRSVSPQHVLLDSDGVPRLFDFGIAKAWSRVRGAPPQGIGKSGLLGYSASEQLHGKTVDRRTDVYAASAVLWEMLAGAPLFAGASEPELAHRVLYEPVVAPSRKRSEVPAGLDSIVLRGLHRDAASRFQSALEMAIAIEREIRVASHSELAAWLHGLAGDRLAARAQALTDMEERGTRRPQLREISAASRHRLAAEQILVPAPLTAAAPKSRAGVPRLLWALSAIAALGSIGLLATPARRSESAKPREAAMAPVHAPQLPIPPPEPPVALPIQDSRGALADTALESPAPTPGRKGKRRDEANAKPARAKPVAAKRPELQARQ